jgi:hypothetical protein
VQYIVTDSDGVDHRLVAKSGTRLYDVLRGHLDSVGYTGPRTGEDDEQ